MPRNTPTNYLAIHKILSRQCKAKMQKEFKRAAQIHRNNFDDLNILNRLDNQHFECAKL